MMKIMIMIMIFVYAFGICMEKILGRWVRNDFFLFMVFVIKFGFLFVYEVLGLYMNFMNFMSFWVFFLLLLMVLLLSY